MVPGPPLGPPLAGGLLTTFVRHNGVFASMAASNRSGSWRGFSRVTSTFHRKMLGWQIIAYCKDSTLEQGIPYTGGIYLKYSGANKTIHFSCIGLHKFIFIPPVYFIFYDDSLTPTQCLMKGPTMVGLKGRFLILGFPDDREKQIGSVNCNWSIERIFKRFPSKGQILPPCPLASFHMILKTHNYSPHPIRPLHL